MLPRAGVRYQTAPSNRSARACSTPAVSAPARGCPPMKRSSDTTGRGDGALGRADVGDDGVRRPPARAPRGRSARARRPARPRTRRPRPRRRRRCPPPRSRSRPARAPAHARASRGPSPTPRLPRARARPARSSRRSARPRGPRPASVQRCAVCTPEALRSRTDSASPSSTSTVVSQPMQPSVIDWP